LFLTLPGAAILVFPASTYVQAAPGSFAWAFGGRERAWSLIISFTLKTVTCLRMKQYVEFQRVSDV